MKDSTQQHGSSIETSLEENLDENESIARQRNSVLNGEFEHADPIYFRTFTIESLKGQRLLLTNEHTSIAAHKWEFKLPI